jgi:hypothetical protein
MIDKKKKHEIGVFSRFAKASALPIIPESIKPQPEPEPDILCVIIGEGHVAFELTRIDDEGFRRILVEMPKRNKQFEAEMARDPETKERFRGAHIATDKPMTVREVWTTLRSTPHDREEFHLRCKNIDICRTNFSHDPRLVNDMVDVKLEALARIQKKIKRVEQGILQTPHPIEILTYFDVQRTTEAIWQAILRSLQADLPAVLSIPQVKRVWVYNNLDDKVMYVYPPF